jgi:hypothetical protein
LPCGFFRSFNLQSGDVWSLRWAFGILMYFTLYGRYPFDGNNVREILLTVLHGTVDWESDVSWLQ